MPGGRPGGGGPRGGPRGGGMHGGSFRRPPMRPMMHRRRPRSCMGCFMVAVIPVFMIALVLMLLF